MPTQSPSSEIRIALLKRIVMHNSRKELILYEGKIAQEFGVSRTPVRQVMQSMASEWLVEVRSGVGTIATPLDKERKAQDLECFLAMLRACSASCAEQKINLVSIDLTTIRLHIEQIDEANANELFFDACTRFAKCLGDLVTDEILKSALVSSYWRFVRRRVAEHKGSFEAATEELVKIIKDAEYGTKNGDGAHVLLMICAAVEELGTSES